MVMRRFGNVDRALMERRTGRLRGRGTGQAAAGRNGWPTASDIGPACRPRYSGPYPFEGLENCAPYGPDAGCRDYILPIDSVDDVPAGATNVLIEQEPQVPFVGRDVVLSSTTVAPFFNIEDIIVGKNSQFVSPGAISGDTFSEVAVRSRLAIDPAYPGKRIAFRVANTSGDPIRFLASIIGNAVE